MRPIFTERVQPNHCLGRLGQDRESVELGQLQAQGQPLRPQRLPEHGDRVAGRLPLRLGWQGRTGHALGPQRQQAPVHFGQRGQHQCPVLLAEQILALRCHWQLHQNLGKFFFVYRMSNTRIKCVLRLLLQRSWVSCYFI